MTFLFFRIKKFSWLHRRRLRPQLFVFDAIRNAKITFFFFFFLRLSFYLVNYFKYMFLIFIMFSIFKQYYTFFLHIFSSICIFKKIENYCLNTRTKQILKSLYFFLFSVLFFFYYYFWKIKDIFFESIPSLWYFVLCTLPKHKWVMPIVCWFLIGF